MRDPTQQERATMRKLTMKIAYSIKGIVWLPQHQIRIESAMSVHRWKDVYPMALDQLPVLNPHFQLVITYDYNGDGENVPQIKAMAILPLVYLEKTSHGLSVEMELQIENGSFRPENITWRESGSGLQGTAQLDQKGNVEVDTFSVGEQSAAQGGRLRHPSIAKQLLASATGAGFG